MEFRLRGDVRCKNVVVSKGYQAALWLEGLREDCEKPTANKSIAAGDTVARAR